MSINPFEYVKTNTTEIQKETSVKNPPKTNKGGPSVWGVEIQKDISISKDKTPKEEISEIEGYEKTSNADIFFDKSKNSYLRWNEDKQKFVKMKDVKTVLKSGYCETKNGSFLDKEGNLLVKKDQGSLSPQKTTDKYLANEMAKIYGVDKTLKSFLYYDKEKKVYVNWDSQKQTFVESNIKDMTKDAIVQIGDKYFDNDNKPVSKKDYLISKNNYRRSNDPEIFFDAKNDKLMYSWDDKAEKFIQVGPEIEMQKLLSQKSDGKISTINQGKKEDCWLISTVTGISEQKSEIINDCIKVDDKENTTITLKGPKKSYTISKEELDAAIKTQKYASGDRDMVAIELAFEKFQNETINNNEVTSQNRFSMYYQHPDSNGGINGGQPRTAIEVLTGKKATSVVWTNNQNVYAQNNIAKMGKKDENTLKQYFDNKDNLIIVSLKDYDESQMDGHALVFKSYDENNVYLIDPNNTTKTTTIDKETFYKKLIGIDYTDFKEPIDEKLSKGKQFKLIESDEVKKYRTSP